MTNLKRTEYIVTVKLGEEREFLVGESSSTALTPALRCSYAPMGYDER